MLCCCCPLCVSISTYLFAAWPASCTDRLLLVRGLSSATKPEELRTAVFKDAAEIVVVKDPAVTCPNVNRKLEKSYANRGEDG